MSRELNLKSQEPNIKQYQNTNIQGSKRYDLEERTLNYAGRTNSYVNNLPRTISNLQNGKQLVRAAGSIGANYIEANEALSKKDFAMRVKISRKEARESRYCLQLTSPDNKQESEKFALIQESTELIKILSAIILKSSMFKV